MVLFEGQTNLLCTLGHETDCTNSFINPFLTLIIKFEPFWILIKWGLTNPMWNLKEMYCYHTKYIYIVNIEPNELYNHKWAYIITTDLVLSCYYRDERKGYFSKMTPVGQTKMLGETPTKMWVKCFWIPFVNELVQAIAKKCLYQIKKKKSVNNFNF